MTLKRLWPAFGAAAALAATAFTLTMTLTAPPRAHAQPVSPSPTDYRIAIGKAIAPVKLTITNQNPNLVYIGSYIVNAQADCNGCHTAPDYGPEYSKDPTLVGNRPPGVVNADAYLGGGTFFATFPGGANIFSRNLTPDITGLPEGGHTLAEFLNIMQMGHDYDMAHPLCPYQGAEGCISNDFGINAAVLQIMPWATFGRMSDADLTAIWTYLSTIPCIAHPGKIPLPQGTPQLPSIIYQTCPHP